MILEDFETDALSHAVAAMQAAVAQRQPGKSSASQHALQVLRPMSGMLTICKESLIRVCRPGADCGGCYMCRAVAPTLCTQCQAAMKTVLCDSSFRECWLCTTRHFENAGCARRIGLRASWPACDTAIASARMRGSFFGRLAIAS